MVCQTTTLVETDSLVFLQYRVNTETTLKKKKRKRHNKVKDRCHWIWSLLLKLVKPQLFPLFANAKLSKLVLLGKSDCTTWGLKSPRSLSVLFCLDTVLRAFTSFCYGKTSTDRMTVLHINKTTAVSRARWGERSRWKMEDKYQDKWILSYNISINHKTAHNPQIFLLVLKCQFL